MHGFPVLWREQKQHHFFRESQHMHGFPVLWRERAGSIACARRRFQAA